MEIKLKNIEDVINNMFIGQALLVSHSIGLFEALKSNPKFEELQHTLLIERRPLQALLSICLSVGLAEFINGRYCLSKEAEMNLTPGNDNYYSDIFNLYIHNHDIFNFTTLKKAILEDKPQVYDGKDVFEENKNNYALTKTFISSMHNKSRNSAKKFAQYINCEEHKIFLDIGGGSGIYTINLCKRYKNVEGIIFDMPIVCKIAQEFIEQENLTSSIKTNKGDLWEDTFPNADIHFYSDIFHDWSYDKCMLLIKKSYKSLPKGGQIIINEKLFNDEKTGPLSAAIYNLKMLLWTEGQQYTYKEILNMLKKVGFKNVLVKNYFKDWSIITALKN